MELKIPEQNQKSYFGVFVQTQFSISHKNSQKQIPFMTYLKTHRKKNGKKGLDKKGLKEECHGVRSSFPTL